MSVYPMPSVNLCLMILTWLHLFFFPCQTYWYKINWRDWRYVFGSSGGNVQNKYRSLGKTNILKAANQSSIYLLLNKPLVDLVCVNPK